MWVEFKEVLIYSLPYALKKSKFKHYIYSMHDLMDYFVDSKKFYYNLNNSIINKIKFVFFFFLKIILFTFIISWVVNLFINY